MLLGLLCVCSSCVRVAVSEVGMTLREKQARFCRMTADLITYAFDMGYELTYGDAYRDPRVFGELGEDLGYGHPNSNHKSRLAVDFNLFKDGVWLNGTRDFEFLGEYWEMNGGDWGGRFGDGNHFSLKHNGVV